MQTFTMGDLSLKCPLCCNQTFDSKLSLIEHLANILTNLSCPICDNKWSSLAHLIEHLNLDDCQSQHNPIKTFDETEENLIDKSLSQNKQNDIENSIGNIELDNDKFDQKSSENSQIQPEAGHIEIKLTTDALNDGKMYVEYVNHQKPNPMMQQGLKLLTEDGVMEQFVVMSPSGEGLSKWGSLVTKQNEDGTISVTTVNDPKESETVIAPSEVEMEDNQELYSCNTCGVSFSSVAEHIQNYHNDQEVVVEESLEDDTNPLAETLEYDKFTNEVLPVPVNKQKTTRQVITETGDIVEESIMIDIASESGNEEYIVPNVLQKVDKQNRNQGKRFVQIDKFCDSLVKNINPSNEKAGAYHKVIVNEIKTSSGVVQKSYSCLSCNIVVNKLEDFKLHPCKTLKYQCVYCSVSYDNSKSLCAHMKVHKVKSEGIVTVDGPVRYECEVCNTSFQSNKSLKLHKRMHDPVKARQIEPPVENPDGTEGSNSSYKCPVCEKMIPIDYLTIHQDSHKSNELNCSICNKKFYSSDYLQMHMTVHSMDKVPVNKTDKVLPYSCSYCNRRFVRPHEKVKHERIHTGEKPHSCEICGKSFRVSYCLTLHMRTHTGARPYTCAHCGKRFKAHSVYNHHLLTHSEIRAYKCPYCPKAFKTSVQLAGHKNSHTKPFSCPHCNRPFASLYAVRVHSETHARQNNLKFSCSLCGASYARAFALKDHVKQVHQQDIDTMELSTVKDWSLKENTDGDVETITLNHKDLSQEISELELSSSELIDAIKAAN